MNEQRSVVSAGLVLAAAVGVFGIAFGAGAVSAGASVWQACVMSLAVFTGASQFSAISVIAAGGGTVAALGGATLLAARNGVYALAMSRVLPRGRLATRLIAAQVTIDESTAMASAARDAADARRAFWVTGIGVYVFWNVGTLVGAVAGSAVDPAVFGLDAAFPSGFVAMLAPLMDQPAHRAAAIGGAVICLVATPVLPVGLPILCAAAAVMLGVRR